MADTSAQLIEGVGNEVLQLFAVTTVLALLAILAIRALFASRANPEIHPESREAVARFRAEAMADQRAATPVTATDTRHSTDQDNQQQQQQQPDPATATDDPNNTSNHDDASILQPPRPMSIYEAGSNCPICLDTISYPCVTNCGHTFCGGCVVAFLETTDVCPLCRQRVTLLMLERLSLVPEEIRSQIYSFNQSHLGVNRSLRERARDVVQIMQRLHRRGELVGTVIGIIYGGLWLVGTCVYVISPFDILPEGTLGLIGYLEDILVVAFGFLIFGQLLLRIIANRR